MTHTDEYQPSTKQIEPSSSGAESKHPENTMVQPSTSQSALDMLIEQCQRNQLTRERDSISAPMPAGTIPYTVIASLPSSVRISSSGSLSAPNSSLPVSRERESIITNASSASIRKGSFMRSISNSWSRLSGRVSKKFRRKKKRNSKYVTISVGSDEPMTETRPAFAQCSDSSTSEDYESITSTSFVSNLGCYNTPEIRDSISAMKSSSPSAAAGKNVKQSTTSIASQNSVTSRTIQDAINRRHSIDSNGNVRTTVYVKSHDPVGHNQTVAVVIPPGHLRADSLENIIKEAIEQKLQAANIHQESDQHKTLAETNIVNQQDMEQQDKPENSLNEQSESFVIYQSESFLRGNTGKCVDSSLDQGDHSDCGRAEDYGSKNQCLSHQLIDSSAKKTESDGDRLETIGLKKQELTDNSQSIDSTSKDTLEEMQYENKVARSHTENYDKSSSDSSIAALELSESIDRRKTTDGVHTQMANDKQTVNQKYYTLESCSTSLSSDNSEPSITDVRGSPQTPAYCRISTNKDQDGVPNQTNCMGDGIFDRHAKIMTNVPSQIVEESEKILNMATLNPLVVTEAETLTYAVLSVQRRSNELEEALQEGIQMPFSEVIRANIGDCHAMGQKPITFLRQVVALCTLPELMSDPRFPADAIDRAKRVLAGCQGGSIGAYSDSAGVEIIRKDVAQYISRRDGGIPCDFNNIMLSTGASDGIKSVLKLLKQPDGWSKVGVMIPIPQYPLYSATLAEYNMYQAGYYLDEATNWSLSTDEMKRAITEARKHCIPRCIVVINPGNPTGQVLTRQNIEAIIKFAYDERLFICADEVYQDNVYAPDREFHSFKKVLTELGRPYSDMELASFHSTSKGYMGECGARGGYAEILNMDPDVKAMLWKSISAKLCPNVSGQAAMEVVVNPPQQGEPSYQQWLGEKTEVLGELKRRAQMVHDRLNSIPGIKCNVVQGAMYAFPSITIPQKAIDKAKSLQQAPDAFYAMNLLETKGICVVPGSGFGQKDGSYHFRMTILPPTEKLKDFLERLEDFHRKFTAAHS